MKLNGNKLASKCTKTVQKDIVNKKTLTEF